MLNNYILVYMFVPYRDENRNTRNRTMSALHDMQKALKQFERIKTL